MSSIHPTDDATVEALLKERYARQQDTAEPAELELVARYVDGQVSGAERARVEAILSADPELAETVALARDAAGEQKVVSLGAARRERKRPPMSFYVAIAAAVVAVIGVSVFVGQGGPGAADEAPMAGAGLGPGAATDHLIVHARGDDGELTLTMGGETPAAGATLRLEYTAKLPGHLMVVEVDATGALTVLYPDGGDRAAAIPAARRGVLDGSPTIGDHAGCAWVIGVFSGEPFGRDQVATALGQVALGATVGCAPPELDAALPFARSIEAWPLK